MAHIMPNYSRIWLALAILASGGVLALPLQERIQFASDPLEAVAVVSFAWSVWLLAKNNPVGWWVGLIGSVMYGILFVKVKLYAEVGIQVFYLVTSLQAIYIWLRGGEAGTEKPVEHAPRSWIVAMLVVVPIAIFGLKLLLEWLQGAVPFWDATTTVLSLAAQIFLMWRYIESWYLWITVDVIYVPLYASRELYATSALYAVFLVLATRGLLFFRQTYQQQQLAGEAA